MKRFTLSTLVSVLSACFTMAAATTSPLARHLPRSNTGNFSVDSVGWIFDFVNTKNGSKIGEIGPLSPNPEELYVQFSAVDSNSEIYNQVTPLISSGNFEPHLPICSLTSLPEAVANIGAALVQMIDGVYSVQGAPAGASGTVVIYTLPTNNSVTGAITNVGPGTLNQTVAKTYYNGTQLRQAMTAEIAEVMVAGGPIACVGTGPFGNDLTDSDTGLGYDLFASAVVINLCIEDFLPSELITEYIGKQNIINMMEACQTNANV